MYEVEGFVSDETMQEKEYPDEHTETFRVEKGSKEYYRNHLDELRGQMKAECGYYFDVLKLAQGLESLQRMDGFLNREVMVDVAGNIGGSIEIEYRTDKPYPLRVRISKHGWYVVAPCWDKDSSSNSAEGDAE